VNVTEELNEKIIGIDFIHAHKLPYDDISRKVMFAGARTNSMANGRQSYSRWRWGMLKGKKL
jgi:hypothetical protein